MILAHHKLQRTKRGVAWKGNQLRIFFIFQISLKELPTQRCYGLGNW
jgi:hypothetical protein